MLQVDLDEVRRAVSIRDRVERAICIGHEHGRAGVDSFFDDLSVFRLCRPFTAV